MSVEKAERGKTKILLRGMAFKRMFMHYAYNFIAAWSSKLLHTQRRIGRFPDDGHYCRRMYSQMCVTAL